MTRAADLLSDLMNELDLVFAGLTALGAAFGALVGDPLRRADVETLRPAILTLLGEHRELVTGAGVVTAPGLLADAPRWLEWWWGEGPEPLRVNLDPTAPDFYDYTTTEWYTAVEPCLAGPYVDWACTNEYAITMSVPVRGFGVAAADVLVASLERRVLPTLVALDRPVALTNAAGRVIASNTPALTPGMRVDAGDRRVPGWRLVDAPVS